MRGEVGSGPAQRFSIGRFLRREVETARGLTERAEEKCLALTSSPGDNPQGGSRPGVGCEHDELRPLEVPVEHVVRLPDRNPHLISIVTITVITKGNS